MIRLGHAAGSRLTPSVAHVALSSCAALVFACVMVLTEPIFGSLPAGAQFVFEIPKTKSGDVGSRSRHRNSRSAHRQRRHNDDDIPVPDTNENQPVQLRPYEAPPLTSGRPEPRRPQ